MVIRICLHYHDSSRIWIIRRRPMARTFVSITIAILVFPIAAPTRADGDIAPASKYAALADSLQPWIAKEVKAKHLPALSIALVDDQKIVWSQGFGFVDPQ